MKPKQDIPIPYSSPEDEIDKYIELNKPKQEKKIPDLLFKILVIISVFLIFIGFYSTFFVEHLEQPSNVPSLDDPHIEYLLQQIKLNNTEIKKEKEMDMVLLLNYYKNYEDFRLKALADYISSKSCRDYEGCAPLALYLFVRDSINYVPDPLQDYFEHPLEVLISHSADCDGMSILLANLLGQIGIRTRFVLIEGHIYVNAYMPDIPLSKKIEGNWVALDPTCKECKFGEVPFSDTFEQRQVII